MASLVAFILIATFIFFYFLPAVIAAGRGHDNAAGVALINFLIGWSGAGWIGCFIWALVGQTTNQKIIERALVAQSIASAVHTLPTQQS
jgi:hypothetical protein